MMTLTDLLAATDPTVLEAQVREARERMNDARRAFGRRLREIREERDMKLRVLAREAGVDPGTLHYIESGGVERWSQPVAEKVAAVLDGFEP